MRLFIYLFFLAGLSCFSQNYALDQIRPELLKNADAVIRNYERQIEIDDIDELIVTIKRTVTVINENGEDFLDAYEYYGEGDKIKDQEAYVYDKFGKEIKHFKKKDFTDQSAYASFILFSDNRVSYLNYTPRSYPYTIEYLSEIERTNSVFIPDWRPVEGYDVSIENSKYIISNPKHFPYRSEVRNFDNIELQKIENEGLLSFEVKDIPAWKSEKYSPNFSSFAPGVLTSLDHFMLEGVEGEASNWKQLGKWMYDNLVEGHDELPEETVNKITDLTKDAKTKEEKIRRIYQYVQDNTRYVAVLYGIGGWEPSPAREVDKLGYGDCKALTNYTKALLKTQGINSYYTVIYGGDKRNIDPDFTKMQGNHVVLNIPNVDSSDIWLECTSQTIPFNYQGDFTDDRYALRVTPEGGEIVKTKHYTEKDNLEETTCELKLDPDGSFNADYVKKSSGIRYGYIYSIEKAPEKKQKQHYREKWSQLQNLNFEKIVLKNNRKKIEFEENLKFSGSGLAVKAGDRLLVPLSFVQAGSIHFENKEKRIRPLQIQRGKTFHDQFIYHLPENFDIEALPESQTITSEFGDFSIEISKTEVDGKNQIEVNRSLIIKEGEWPAEKYDAFRAFFSSINRLNNLKAVIVSTKKA